MLLIDHYFIIIKKIIFFFAGVPITVKFASTFFITVAPAPIIDPFFIVTFGIIFTPVPTNTFSSILTLPAIDVFGEINEKSEIFVS